MGVLLTVGILAMVGCVIWLSVVNRRRLARQQAAAATAVHLAPTSRAAAVGNIDLVWRRTDQRRAFALLEGIHRGWQTKAFLFRHDQDLVERGGRTLVGLFARRFLSVFDLVFDARTAQQRGVLVAVDYSGAPGTVQAPRTPARRSGCLRAGGPGEPVTPTGDVGAASQGPRRPRMGVPAKLLCRAAVDRTVRARVGRDMRTARVRGCNASGGERLHGDAGLLMAFDVQSHCEMRTSPAIPNR